MKAKAAKMTQAKRARRPHPQSGELTDDALDQVAGGLVDVCRTPTPGGPVPIPYPNVVSPLPAPKKPGRA
jgi:hypothetical protein